MKWPIDSVQFGVRRLLIAVTTLVSFTACNFQILKSASNSQIYGRFSLSQIDIQSLTYALSLTNKSAIDLRIWKRHWFDNTVKSDRDLRQWRQWMPIWVWSDLILSYTFQFTENWDKPFDIHILKCLFNILWTDQILFLYVKWRTGI